jgi:ParB family chromosome partitioning protein
MIVAEQSNTTTRLGRGLASLIGDVPKEVISNDSQDEINVSLIPIENIQANKQNPRSVFSEEELIDLSNSIKEKGIVQPIIVRQRANENSYEVIAGERRWRAAQIAQLDKIPAIIKTLSDDDALEIAIIENVQRSNLNPIDEASGYKRLIDIYNYTQEDLANVIGKSRSYIANILRLTNLPLKVQEYLASGQITIGHARALIGSDDAEKIANLIIEKGLSVRQTEDLLKQKKTNTISSHKTNTKDQNILNLEKTITDAIGFKVEIQTKDNKSGKLIISYSDNLQLDKIKSKLIN